MLGVMKRRSGLRQPPRHIITHFNRFVKEVHEEIKEVK